MRYRLFGLAVALSILCVSLVRAADFSADMVSTTREGQITGKVFFSGFKTRMETEGTVTISRADLMRVWMLMPEDQMYMEMEMFNVGMVSPSDIVPGETSRVLLATEDIPGVGITEKYEVNFKTDEQNEEAMLLWVAKDSRIPVKSAAPDKSWVVEYRNIKIEKQDDGLFEVPAGYKPIAAELPSLGYE